MRFYLSIALILLVVSRQFSFAQEKIHTVNGDTFETSLLSIDRNMVNLKPFLSGNTTISKLPRNYIKEIEFADGFKFRFTPEGELVRDSLSAAPVVRAKGTRLYAEGIVGLTGDETRQFLGDDKFYMAYKPARMRMSVAWGQLASGLGLLLAGGLMDDKEVSFNDGDGGVVFNGLTIMPLSSVWMPYTTIYSGHINPYAVGLEFLGTVTALSGIANSVISVCKVRSLLSGNSMSSSRSAAVAGLWTGVGLMAAGAGAIVGGIADMSRKSDWNYILRDEAINEHVLNPDHYYHDQITGEMPVAGAIITAVGSILLNIGISEFVVSETILKGHSTRSASDRSLALNYGLTPSGASLCITF